MTTGRAQEGHGALQRLLELWPQHLRIAGCRVGEGSPEGDKSLLDRVDPARIALGDDFLQGLEPEVGVGGEGHRSRVSATVRLECGLDPVPYLAQLGHVIGLHRLSRSARGPFEG